MNYIKAGMILTPREELKQSVLIEDVLNLFKVTFNEDGYFCLPNHFGKYDNCKILEQSKFFICSATGEAGDIFRLWSRLAGCTTKEAIAEMIDVYNN